MTTKKVKKTKGKQISSGNTGVNKKKPILPRGRTFKGVVIKKFPKRVTIELERTVYLPKYERFLKKNTRIKARLPDENSSDVHIGDVIKVQECRPLSKTIHCIFLEKVASAEENK